MLGCRAYGVAGPMLQQVYQIRSIQPEDNAVLAETIVSVVREYGCTDSEYLSNTAELADLHTSFTGPDAGYWVAVDPEGKGLVGGGGITRLKGTTPEEAVCELQKLYLAAAARGKGLGGALMKTILDSARKKGYRAMYLECVPQLADAIKLYESFGFRTLDARMGNTGHNSCSIFMMCDL
jgi:putative acetyltransferase